MTVLPMISIDQYCLVSVGSTEMLTDGFGGPCLGTRDSCCRIAGERTTGCPFLWPSFWSCHGVHGVSSSFVILCYPHRLNGRPSMCAKQSHCAVDRSVSYVNSLPCNGLINFEEVPVAPYLFTAQWYPSPWSTRITEAYLWYTVHI